MRTAFVAALACLVFAVPAVPAQPPQATPIPAGLTKVGTVEGITEYRLTNGLRVLLLPDASQPKLTVNLTVFVGSRHEGYGETGMAHLLEHMVFKGCPKFPDVPKALRDHGAQFNGTTWTDRTNYFETMPASDANLEFGIELEADRMVNSFIKREDLMSEFTVVRNEFERGENSPIRVLLQRMLATAYEWHNYGKSTIGNRTDIERVPVDSLRAFYKKYYRPDNALLIVAGQFDEAKALGYVSKYFGPLKNPDEPLPATYTEEPPQDGARVVTLTRVGGVGAAGATYHIPAAAHPDFAAVEVLNQVLAEDGTGRLYEALVKAKKAAQVFGVAFNWKDPGVLVALAQTDPDKVEEAKQTLVDTLENLAKKPITAEEVERAKRQLLVEREKTLANSQQFAVGLSNWAGAGDWRLFFLHRDRLEKVTAADVNRVAEKYLIPSNRTVGVFLPTKEPARAAVPETPDVAKLLEGYKGREAMAAGEAFDPTPENVEKRVQRGKVGDAFDYALLPKKTRGETVNFSLTLRFGSLDTLKNKATAAEFVGPMLMRGSKSKTRQQIKDEFDKLNARVTIGSSPGQIRVTGETKRANLPAVLALLREVLREPTFPADELDEMKREQLQQYREARTEPQQLADNLLSRRLGQYPPDDPRYTPTLAESEELIAAVTAEQLRELYATQVGGTGQAAVVGDFAPPAAVAGLEQIVGGWNATVPFKRIERTAELAKPGLEKIVTPDKANAYYTAGQNVKVRDSDPAYPALAVGNYSLGQAPLASRLSNRVRGKDGLSYTVRSYVTASPLDDAGQFNMMAITNPTNMPKVESAMMEELQKFLNDGLSADELEQAKNAYVQSLRVMRGNDSVLASQLATGLYVGRTFAYYADLEAAIGKLQPGDVKAAFDKVLDPKNLVIIEAGDFKK